MNYNLSNYYWRTEGIRLLDDDNNAPSIQCRVEKAFDRGFDAGVRFGVSMYKREDDSPISTTINFPSTLQ